MHWEALMRGTRTSPPSMGQGPWLRVLGGHLEWYIVHDAIKTMLLLITYQHRKVLFTSPHPNTIPIPSYPSYPTYRNAILLLHPSQTCYLYSDYKILFVPFILHNAATVPIVCFKQIVECASDKMKPGIEKDSQRTRSPPIGRFISLCTVIGFHHQRPYSCKTFKD